MNKKLSVHNNFCRIYKNCCDQEWSTSTVEIWNIPKNHRKYSYNSIFILYSKRLSKIDKDFFLKYENIGDIYNVAIWMVMKFGHAFIEIKEM